jgi:hypothetical protein
VPPAYSIYWALYFVVCTCWFKLCTFLKSSVLSFLKLDAFCAFCFRNVQGFQCAVFHSQCRAFCFIKKYSMYFDLVLWYAVLYSASVFLLLNYFKQIKNFFYKEYLQTRNKDRAVFVLSIFRAGWFYVDNTSTVTVTLPPQPSPPSSFFQLTWGAFLGQKDPFALFSTFRKGCFSLNTYLCLKLNHFRRIWDRGR